MGEAKAISLPPCGFLYEMGLAFQVNWCCVVQVVGAEARVTDQLGFADAFVDPRLGANHKLARIKKGTLVDATLIRAAHNPPPVAAHPREPGAEGTHKAKRRPPVEVVLSALKRLYGQGRARCHSLARNAADRFACLTVSNLRRATLTGQGRRPTPAPPERTRISPTAARSRLTMHHYHPPHPQTPLPAAFRNSHSRFAEESTRGEGRLGRAARDGSFRRLRRPCTWGGSVGAS
jgi:hypothetical protein